MVRFMVLLAILVVLPDAGDVIIALFANALYDFLKRRL